MEKYKNFSVIVIAFNDESSEKKESEEQEKDIITWRNILISFKQYGDY